MIRFQSPTWSCGEGGPVVEAGVPVSVRSRRGGTAGHWVAHPVRGHEAVAGHAPTDAKGAAVKRLKRHVAHECMRYKWGLSRRCDGTLHVVHERAMSVSTSDRQLCSSERPGLCGRGVANEGPREWITAEDKGTEAWEHCQGCMTELLMEGGRIGTGRTSALLTLCRTITCIHLQVRVTRHRDTGPCPNLSFTKYKGSEGFATMNAGLLETVSKI